MIFWLIQLTIFTDVNGHGYLKTPRSRNWVAAEDGTWNGGPEYAGIPQTESCPHCSNMKDADDLCGVGNAVTKYDHWNDINGDPMPWTSQAIYEEGGEITVEAVLSTNHAGHMEMWLCPDGNDSTQECLWSNPATMVRDELYGGPADPNYPERAYFGTSIDFRFTYKLPEGLTGDQVLVQWRYITANSCIPPGYRPGNPVGDALLELGWLRSLGMADCLPPYPPDGSRGANSPEQFWGCAEITIIPSGPTPPTMSPAPSPTNPVGVPTSSPVSQPGPAPGYCNYGFYREYSCDGLVEGGDWCNLSVEHCEGSCSGEWCLNDPVTSVPSPPSSPTMLPTIDNPTTQPTVTSPPTLLPGTISPTEEPSIYPSLLPSDSMCIDSPLTVFVDGQELTCQWIASNSACLCDVPFVSSHCPQACHSCSTYGCSDSEGTFSYQGNIANCDLFDAFNDDFVNNVCDLISEIESTCRGSCGICD